VAVDAQGGVHLLVQSGGHGLEPPSLRVHRFDPAGAWQWTHVFTVKDQSVTGGGIAVDADGHVYVAGATTGRLGAATFGGTDAFVAKLDPTGAVSWLHQFGSAAGDAATAVALAPDGSLRVALVSEGTPPGAQPNLGGIDAFLMRIDADGSPGWTRRVGSASQESLSVGRHLAVDAHGASVLAGGTSGPFAGPDSHVGQDDIFLVRVDAAGGEVWRRQFGTAATEVTHAVALDAEGFVWVAGATDGHLAPDDPDQAGRNAFLLRGWP
jgi:hypothetical protein